MVGHQAKGMNAVAEANCPFVQKEVKAIAVVSVGKIAYPRMPRRSLTSKPQLGVGHFIGNEREGGAHIIGNVPNAAGAEVDEGPQGFRLGDQTPVAFSV
jgi:hypothetical protein